MSEPLNISDSTRQLLQQRAEEEGCSVDTLLIRWLSVALTTESIPYTYFDTLPSEVVLVDVTQPYQPLIYVNRAFEQVTGYTLAEIQGRNLRFLQGEDRDQPGRTMLREAIQNGQSAVALLRNYRKDGTLFWTEVSIAPMRDSRGQITRYIGTQQDVTERVKAEEALRHTEELYRLLAEHSRDGISLHHPDGRFIYANPHYAGLGGYSPAELLAFSPEELSLLVHPDDLPRTRHEAHQQVLRGETVTRLEFRLRQKDGGYTWVENISVPIVDDNGQVVRILATTRDISERKRIEEQIELQFTALEATANAIVITDRTARIQWVNPAFSRLTGYSIEEARGSNPNMLVKSGLHDEAFYREMWETILSGNVWFGKLINRRKDGSLYTEEQTITPVYDNDGKISHFIAIKQDITERERSQQMLLDYEGLKARFQMEQEQNALIQQTIAALSHDIRTPLSVIATTKDLLSRHFNQLSDENRQAKLDSIGRQLQYAIELLDDTVKVAKSNLNHREFRPREVNLAALCRVSIEQVSLVHSTTHHLMFVNLSSIETFVCDEILVSRILLNLLSNAVKYSPMGGTVRLELRQDEAWVVLRVVDQGLGISETDLPLIFDPFYRSENVNTIGGTGLGLSIVKDCVVRHGGRIRVESVLGRGSTFIVELPR